MTPSNTFIGRTYSRLNFSALLPLVLISGVVLAMSMLWPDDAGSSEKGKYSYLSVVSPDAQQITISDTAHLDDVVQILRANNATFEGPIPEVINDSGEPETVGYKLIIRLDTYNPRGATDPGCPYRQVTDLRYDLQGRLYVYYVSYQPLCIK